MSPQVSDATLVVMTEASGRPQVELLTRDGCTICERVHARLVELAAELGFELSMTDVDAAAAAGISAADPPGAASPAGAGQLFGSPADKRLPWTAVQLLEEARELAR